MKELPQELWNNCLRFFQQNLNEQQYRTWFVPTQFKSYDAKENLLSIYIPSQFYYEYLEQHFRKLIYAAIIRYFGKETRLTYQVKVVSDSIVNQESDRSPIIAPPPQKNQSAPAQDLNPQLNTRQNFENFIAGVANELPRAIGLSIADNPSQRTFNPLFIYGPSGVGKTHLVNAIGTRLKQKQPQMRVLYVSAHLFQVQYTDSVRHNTINDFINFYQSIDVLIIDDVQEFAALKGTQNTFFHIFNHLHQNGRQIILTSDRPPTQLMGMEERMLTRFKWGLLAQLSKPEEKLREAILTSKIHQDGLNIDEEVIQYLAKHVNESVRELEGIIHSLLANSIVYKKDVVDLEFVKLILHHNQSPTPQPTVSLDAIVKTSCEECEVKPELIYGKSRKADVAETRQICMYLASKYARLTISRIGVLLGNRNHATIGHGVKTIQNKMKENKVLRDKVQRIETKLSTQR